MDQGARKKLLVTGASGFLGWNLCRLAAEQYEVVGIFQRRPIALPGIIAERCDLTKFSEVNVMMRRIRPDAVVHAAAIANPDVCQENPVDSRLLNVDAAVSLAGTCSDARIPFLFTSTDLVFDGTSPPYAEESAPSPINIYGEQKIEAERAILARHAGAIICRMPLMFGDVPQGAQSLIQPLIRALNSGTAVSLFVDEFRTPVSGATAAAGILAMLKVKPTIIHLGGRERISRYELGKLVAAALGKDAASLRAARAGDTVRPALRPRDVSFDSGRAFSLGYQPQTLEKEIEALECIRMVKGRIGPPPRA